MRFHLHFLLVYCPSKKTFLPHLTLHCTLPTLESFPALKTTSCNSVYPVLRSLPCVSPVVSIYSTPTQALPPPTLLPRPLLPSAPVTSFFSAPVTSLFCFLIFLSNPASFCQLLLLPLLPLPRSALQLYTFFHPASFFYPLPAHLYFLSPCYFYRLYLLLTLLYP